MEKALERFDRILIFFTIYTIVFLLFFNTLSYTLPFVIAFIFALMLKVPTRFLMNKFKMSNSLAAIITTIIFYAIFFTLLIWMITALVSETINLVKNISSYIAAQNFSIPDTFDRLKNYYNNLDPAIIKTIDTNFADINKKAVTIVSNFGFGVLNFLTAILSSVPYLLMLFIFTLIATYFFTKDISNTKNGEKFFSLFSNNSSKILYVFNETKRMLFNYTKAYLLVIFITFLVTLIGFLIFGIKYAFVLSLLCGILDLLPVLGIPMVYFPLAIYYGLNHHYPTAIGLIILYALVFIVRQITEPRLVSANLGIHPVAVLAAFFVGLKAAGIMGMVYCIFLVVFYNIFKKVDVL